MILEPIQQTEEMTRIESRITELQAKVSAAHANGYADYTIDEATNGGRVFGQKGYRQLEADRAELSNLQFQLGNLRHKAEQSVRMSYQISQTVQRVQEEVWRSNTGLLTDRLKPTVRANYEAMLKGVDWSEARTEAQLKQLVQIVWNEAFIAAQRKPQGAVDNERGLTDEDDTQPDPNDAVNEFGFNPTKDAIAYELTERFKTLKGGRSRVLGNRNVS